MFTTIQRLSNTTFAAMAQSRPNDDFQTMFKYSNASCLYSLKIFVLNIFAEDVQEIHRLPKKNLKMAAQKLVWKKYTLR